MTDLRKAAEMALEALDGLSEPYDVLKAQEALRQALAQPEQYDQTALELCDVCGWKAIIPDEGCLVCARKEQEPVAWLMSGELFFPYEYQPIAEPNDGGKPLYTAPPKRKWVGLTDQELHDLARWADEHGGTFHTAYGKAIEAKLKEKNSE